MGRNGRRVTEIEPTATQTTLNGTLQAVCCHAKTIPDRFFLIAAEVKRSKRGVKIKGRCGVTFLVPLAHPAHVRFLSATTIVDFQVRVRPHGGASYVQTSQRTRVDGGS